MMDCNREEAIRAKGLAEKKMLGKDFLGAQKVALRAQQLYPDLDNISQMLTVCDVHCSAERKVLGSEMNWYAILQIEQTADEALIKKQYRKLALLLHPDKNKFAGAEAAFKLIGEAQRVLSDQAKRSQFDLKLRASVRTAASRQPPQPRFRNTYVTKDPGLNSSYVNNSIPQFTTMNPHQRQHQQQQQREPIFSNGQQTFWTVCPFCNIRYQYYKDVVNRALRCQSCLKTFFAYDLDGQGVPPSSTQPQFFQETVVLNQGGHKIGPQVNVGNSSSSMGFRGNPKMSEPSIKTDGISEVDRASKTKRDESAHASSRDRKDRKEGPKFQTEKSGTSRKRVRTKEESSESCDTGDSSESEDYRTLEEVGPAAKQDSGINGGRYPRRSSRQKHQVSYNENLSDDDDFVRTSKRPKGSGLSNVAEDQRQAPVNEETCRTRTNGAATFPAVFKEDNKGETQKGPVCTDENLPNGRDKVEEHKQKGKAAVVEDKKEVPEVHGSRSTTNSDTEFFDVPDPDFYEFDKDRKEECFAVNQTWAIYDNIDGMPRFYAQIRKVFSPGFKVRIIWLEADPHNQEGIHWMGEGLPVACGQFKQGKSMITEDINMFSHLVYLEKHPSGRSYKMYPQKGEIWALFKNWHINWRSDPDNHRKYEFEFVKVLSDYSEGSGISVAYLVKIKGFVSLFRLKKGKLSFQIPPNELLRFSHRVPSNRTTGNEREDVPEGYFELDPASLPHNLENLADSEDLKMKIETIDGKINGSCSESSDNERPSVLEKCINPGEKDSPNRKSKSRKGSSKLDGSHIVDDQKKVSWCAINEESCDLSEQSRGSTGDGPAETSADYVTEDLSPPRPSMEPCEIPEAVFHYFEEERTMDKFQPGQIWALYCDVDSLPKYYAQINKINQALDFKLRITWLESCPPPKGTIQWFDKDIPICCGKFKIAAGEEVDMEATSFSHQVRVKPSGKNKYEIYPSKGDVWALYKNFNSEWTCSDLENCEYDMVEVLEENDLKVKVLVLVQVDGHQTIFTAKRDGKSLVKMEISRIELLRFSHKVPAFLLKEELDGTLRGCWELDPQSLPVSLFRSTN